MLGSARRPSIKATIALAMSIFLFTSAFASAQASDPNGPPLARGDLVQLRSGGALMTIQVVKGDLVNCVWIGEDGEPHNATFLRGLLEKSDPNSGAVASR